MSLSELILFISAPIQPRWGDLSLIADGTLPVSSCQGQGEGFLSQTLGSGEPDVIHPKDTGLLVQVESPLPSVFFE